MKRILITFLTVLLSLGFCLSTTSAQNNDTPGAVYTMTNAADGNEVIIFDRNPKGRLTQVGSIATGGNGSGGELDPLGSQSSLLLSLDQRWLLAVNAGSDEVSVFRVLPEGLSLADVIGSGGDFPVSVTMYHNLVYVLNAGTSPTITGFILSHAGELTPLANSTRSLGSGAFAQVGFDPRGVNLVITDREENEILVYAVGKDGLPGADPATTMSSGLGPFGFIFDRQGNPVVSEAGSGAVSSYSILPDGTLQVISPSVSNGQAATCWIAGDEGFAFTSNTASSTISGYIVERGKGSVVLNQAVAGLGNLNIDLSVTVNGRFLYVLNAGAGTIGMFRIGPNGSLIDLGAVDAGLSIFAQGIAAR